MDQTATSTSASATKVLDPDAARTFTFPNGTLNKHQPPQQHHHRRPASPEVLQFRECLKNHAASLGGHALDGCGEFMPSPATNPADPTSLRCAACGCHRNFHRRLPVPLPPFHPRHHRESHLDAGNRREEQEGDDVDDDEDKEEAEEDEDGEEIDNGRYRTHPRPRRRSNSPAHVAYSSAPHMLLALSSGLSHASGPNLVRPVASTPLAQQPAASAAGPPRKRLRTKFSPEQKKRMQELSEKLGWRMQKRDETMVEEWCREIGVSRGVFKVWMHNNKHQYLGSARRGGAELGGSGSLGCGIQRAPSGDDIAGGINCNMVNGSSSSS